MTPFLAGIAFGAIFTAAAAAAIVTRVQRPREDEQWERELIEPPAFHPKTTITKRHYSL